MPVKRTRKRRVGRPRKRVQKKRMVRRRKTGRGIGSWLKKGIKSVGRYVKKNKLLSKGAKLYGSSGLFGSNVAGKSAKYLKMAGYGKKKGGGLGRAGGGLRRAGAGKRRLKYRKQTIFP